MTIPPNPRELALDATKSAINRSGYWLPVDGQAAVVDAIAAVYEADAEQIRDELTENAGILQALRRHRNEAEDALARIRALAAEWASTGAQLGAVIPMGEAADALLAALAETEEVSP